MTSNTLKSPFSRSLEGKVALVTGGARNLGASFAAALAAAGATTVVHYNRPSSHDDAKSVVKSIQDNGGTGQCIQADLTHMDEIQSLLLQTKEAFGRIDIVVNNAGVMQKGPIGKTTEAQFDQVFSVNSKAAFFVMKEAATYLQDNGRIINIGTSLLGSFTGLYAAYAGSKAPLEDFSRALAKEVGARGITVNTICPGPVDTDFLTTVETDETLNWLANGSVTGRLGRPEDITPWIVFLSTPAAGWATGQTFFVNGGFATR